MAARNLSGWLGRRLRQALGVDGLEARLEETRRFAAGELQLLHERIGRLERRLRRAALRERLQHLGTYLREEAQGLSSPDPPKRMIFVSARFRTGSSFLYTLLAQPAEVAPYYEPLNPDALSVVDRSAEDEARARVLLGHTLKEGYFERYRSLDRERWRRLHGEALVSTDLLLGRHDDGSELYDYLQFLIEAAGPRLPVFQFNRMDFRLGWARVAFPQALIVNLRRSPRAVFRSYRAVQLREETPRGGRLGAYFQLDEMFEAVGALLTPTGFPGQWSDYEKIYLLNRLSDLWADHFAHEVVAFDELVQRPAEIAAAFLGRIGISVDAAHLAVPAPISDSTDVAGDPHDEASYAASEQRCEKWLGEVLA